MKKQMKRINLISSRVNQGRGRLSFVELFVA